MLVLACGGDRASPKGRSSADTNATLSLVKKDSTTASASLGQEPDSEWTSTPDSFGEIAINFSTIRHEAAGVWSGWFRLLPAKPHIERDGKKARKLLWHVIADCRKGQTYVRSHADYDSLGHLLVSEDFSSTSPVWTDPIPGSNGGDMLKSLCDFENDLVKARKTRP